MHPIERLRYVARASGGDQRVIVRETAAALRGLQLDPAGLVVACRRIVERHPTSGALWWLCARLLTSADPFAEAWRLSDEIEEDPTPQRIHDALPDDATVCVLGWPDLAGEALGRRGDVRVLAVDVDGEGRSFVRRLLQHDVEAELVPPAGVASAVVSSDLVVLEAHGCGSSAVLAEMGSHAAAAAGYCAELPVWLVVGRGRRLPEQMFAAMIERAGASCEPWEQAVEPVGLALVTHLVTPDGLAPVDQAPSEPECALAPELLRSSPI